MTGSGILDFIISHCDKNSDDTVYRALALKWLNLVLKDIQNKQESYHWRFLEVRATTFNTAASDYDYALATIASNIDTTKAIHVYEKTNDVTLTFVPYERFKQLIADETASSGDPRFFTIFAGMLLLWPTPDAIVAFYIDYVKLITAATDSLTSLDVSDKYEKTIIDGVLEYAYQFDPELGSSADQRTRYREGVEQMIRENSQMIAENTMPMSHRDKYRMRDEVDGKNSILFPLEGTSI